MKALIVEDSTSYQLLIEKVLRQVGVETLCVKTELWRNLGDEADQAASFVDVAMTATPSVNVMPSTTFGN